MRVSADGQIDIDGDPARGVLHRDDARQCDDAELGRAVIALPDIAEQSRGRRHHDDAAVILLAEQVDRRAIDVEMPGQMHVDDRLPILGEHVVKHFVAQDAGGVEDDVQPAERLARLAHHREAVVEFGDRAIIGDRVAARRLDLVDDFLRRRLVGAFAAAAGAGIVDNDLGAVRGHQFGDFAADPAPRAGADRDPSVEHAHPRSPSFLVSSRGLSGPRPVLSIAAARVSRGWL